MHIQKNHKIQNPSQCPQLSVDSWKDKVKEDENFKGVLVDEYEGNIVKKDVKEKKYLCNMISNSLKNKKTLQIEPIRLQEIQKRSFLGYKRDHMEGMHTGQPNL